MPSELLLCHLSKATREGTLPSVQSYKGGYLPWISLFEGVLRVHWIGVTSVPAASCVMKVIHMAVRITMHAFVVGSRGGGGGGKRPSFVVGTYLCEVSDTLENAALSCERIFSPRFLSMFPVGGRGHNKSAAAICIYHRARNNSLTADKFRSVLVQPFNRMLVYSVAV